MLIYYGKVELRYCVRCNKPFMSSHPRKKTCSVKCSNELRKSEQLKFNRIHILYDKNYFKKEYQKRIKKIGRRKLSENALKRRDKKFAEVIAILGNKCVICGFERPQNQKLRQITFHEIHGKRHPENPYYILAHIEDFVPLCGFCHITLHRLHDLENKKKFFELLKNLSE